MVAIASNTAAFKLAGVPASDAIDDDQLYTDHYCAEPAATAMGTQATPPNQVLLGIALFLTFFIMSPVLSQVYDTAWQPLSNETINFEEFLLRAS